MSFILALIAFGLLITIHEFGHYLVAKRVGIRVHEFSIGIGPRLAGVKAGETLYSLRLLPLFGFVRMAGTEPGEVVPDDRGFNQKGVLERMAVIAAGPGMNFLLAVVLFSLIYGVVGVFDERTVIGGLVPGSPAAQAGLEPGDRVIMVDGQAVANWGEMVRAIQRNPNRAIGLSVLRGGSELDVRVTPVVDPETGKGFIGIRRSLVRFGPLASVQQGLLQTGAVVAVWFKSIFLILTGRIQAEVAGPVGIVQMLQEASEVSIGYFLFLAAALSATVGLINLLPIPALDGSRLVFLTVEGVRGRPVDPAKENFIHFLGFALLLLVAVVVTYRDILRLGT